MNRIQVLDQKTIDQIAAGEVIERPASVVKELVENSIDAGATAVTVEIRDGGTSFIRVTDNGSGIEGDQVATAFLRHSTSKIRAVEDLFHVASLGFRGEALSSIASIAMVELITKTADAEEGVRYVIEGGAEEKLEETAAPDGTTFLVRSLFYNTPARRKFLKSPMTEAGYVSELMERLALSRPDISFQFITNGQTKLHTSGNHNLKDVIYHIYGRDVAANLAQIEAEQGPVCISGFVGKPVVSRGNRSYENYFINGRYIRSNLIAKGIEEGYRTFLMQHKYPFTALHFFFFWSLLDVNVHPTKMELRFSNQEELYRFVRDTVRQALMERELIPEVKLTEEPDPGKQQEIKQQEKLPEKQPEKERPDPASRLAGEAAAKREAVPSTPQERNLEYFLAEMRKRVTGEFKRKEQEKAGQERACGSPGGEILRERGSYVWKPSEKTQAQAAPAEARPQSQPCEPQLPSEPPLPEGEPEQLDLFEQRLLNPATKSDIRIIGQLFDTYWLVQFEDKFYMIDQHAAHEKVLYERTLKSLADKEITSQMVSPPLILTLSMQEAEKLSAYQDYFRELGFEIEPFGGKEYAVRGVPANLPSLARKDLLLEMLDGLSEDTALGSPDMIWDKVASMSCKAAVKGRHAMSPAEADALIGQLLSLENPYACPHGRPTIISMSKYELEKKFKRIV